MVYPGHDDGSYLGVYLARTLFGSMKLGHRDFLGAARTAIRETTVSQKHRMQIAVLLSASSTRVASRELPESVLAHRKPPRPSLPSRNRNRFIIRVRSARPYAKRKKEEAERTLCEARPRRARNSNRTDGPMDGFTLGSFCLPLRRKPDKVGNREVS